MEGLTGQLDVPTTKTLPLGCGVAADGADREARMKQLRGDILAMVAEYAVLQTAPRAFVPGRTLVPFAGRVYDEREMVSLVGASLDFWLTAGRCAHQLEARLASYVGVRHCLLVNSGSSANLLAFASLCSPRLGDRRIVAGDEVVTIAASFPTTVAPIIQYGAIPVFVDIDPLTVNIDISQLEAALSPRTRAVMVAHTLGNPFDLDAVQAFCQAHNLWLIEDNCDALGSLWQSADGSTGRTGSFGHLATSSFYPAHHMTTGEGGAVYTSDPLLASIAESLRDWGRDCHCPSGKSNTCGERFCRQLGDLPYGYDHKYTYSQLGYNLKITDLQAAIGLAQIDKLPSLVASRRANHEFLSSVLEPYQDRASVQKATPGSTPSWFGLMMTVEPGSGLERDRAVALLEEAKIQTRMLFAGNLVRQPCFSELRAEGTGYRVVGDLVHTDRIMNDGLWVGVYPGLSEPQLDYMASTLQGIFALSRVR
jgi:CDP-6-deoxy-D-xylo-4-hexulose-3-dehydrase